jgi:sulfite dehydrogenase
MKVTLPSSAARTALALTAAGLALAGAPAAHATEITLPRETAVLTPAPLPGYALAQAMCATCHSADYVLYQPVSSRAYWQATVVKMQKVFAAPLPDTAIDPIVDYLTKTYGPERDAPVAPKQG